ncbi:MAG: hypothetical protein P1U63_06965 [Coxiellaceae bacterium]|nr:hypothetical protein [Coxiellaceae bacterium]
MSQSQHLDLPLWVPLVAALGVSVLVVCVASAARRYRDGDRMCPDINLSSCVTSCCRLFSARRNRNLELPYSNDGFGERIPVAEYRTLPDQLGL